MYDFERFVYLDVQKTGSTFVGNLLKTCSKRPMIYFSKHTPARDLTVAASVNLLKRRKLRRLWKRAGFYRQDAIYFNSIRHPFDLYASLYNYGCDGNGSVFGKLRQQGAESLYDGTPEGFLRWTEFMLDPGNAKLLKGEYSRCADAVGFMTYRFLNLSFRNPARQLGHITDRAAAREIYRERNICVATLRLENIREDFEALVETHLADIVDRGKVSDFFAAGRINASQSKAGKSSALGESAVGDLVREREFLIFELFYPDS